MFHNFAAKDKEGTDWFMEIRRKYVNLALGVVALALVVSIVASIMKPMGFNNAVAEREKVVIERMKVIRTAAARYHDVYDNTFCSTIDSLVLKGYLDDSLKYIPFSDGKKFEIETAYIQTKSGHSVSVMECRAYYEDYLNGMGKDYIKEVKDKADAEGRFPGLKFGDLNVASNNAGNWE